VIEPHNPTPEPILCDKKDGQWYAQEGVDVKETQQRKGMVYCFLCVLFLFPGKLYLLRLSISRPTTRLFRKSLQWFQWNSGALGPSLTLFLLPCLLYLF